MCCLENKQKNKQDKNVGSILNTPTSLKFNYIFMFCLSDRKQTLICFFGLLCLLSYSCIIAEEKDDNLYTLEPVEVTAYRFGINTLDVPVYAQQITRKDIEETASMSIPEVLTKKANVRFMSYSAGNFEGNIAMRGFGEQSQTRILILVDGVRYNPSDMAGINWSTIPVGSVENIEILRGSQSTLYGSHAEAGVIKISTIKESDGYNTFINGMYGSYNTYKADALISGRENDYFFSVNASRSSTDGYRDFSDAYSNYASLMVGCDFTPSTTLILKGDYCDSEINYPAGVGWNIFQTNPQFSPCLSMGFKDKTSLYTANLNSETSSMKLDATLGTRIRYREIFEEFIDFPKENNQITITFSPRVEFTNIEDFCLIAGVDSNYAVIDLNEYSFAQKFNQKYKSRDANASRFDVGVYGISTYNISDDLIFSTGGRADSAYTSADWSTFTITGNKNPTLNKIGDFNDSIWNLGFSGDIGITYKLTKTSSIYARFDQIFHYPTTDEIAYYQTGSAKPFNTDLDPEHGQNYEIGYKLKNNKISSNINLFLLYLQNEISYDANKGLNLNLEPTIRYGLDFDASFDDEYWGISVFGTLVKSQFAGGKYDGCKIPLVAPFNGSIQAYIKPLENLKLLSRITYSTNSVMGNDYDNNEQRIPSYYTLDIQVNYSPIENITIFSAVDNITNENYAMFGYSGVFYPNLGRTFKFGINIKL